jgi:DNA-binding transcriptional ArsR family regulator
MRPLEEDAERILRIPHDRQSEPVVPAGGDLLDLLGKQLTTLFSSAMGDGEGFTVTLNVQRMPSEKAPAGPELSEVEKIVLRFLRGRKERLLAKQVQSAMMREEKVKLSQSVVERALSRLRAAGLVTNVQGHGYEIANM